MSTQTSDVRVVADRLAFSLADGRTLFSDLTLGFGHERTGLTGANGTGKSTLVRLLAGELRPSAGTIVRAGTLSYLPQDFQVRAEQPLAGVLGISDRLARVERVLAGDASTEDLDLVAGDWDLRERAEAVLARLGLPHLHLDRPVLDVSGGEATRVALAGVLLAEPDFLLLDEPTNNLDAAGREALYGFVEGWTGGLLAVSHDRGLLRRMDRIVELTPAGARVYGGGYDLYREQRGAEADAAARELTSAEAALRAARREAQQMRERQARRDSRGKRVAAEGGIPKIMLGMMKERAEGTGARVRETGARLVEDGRARLDAARGRVDEQARLALDLPSAAVPAGKTVVELDAVRYAHPGAASPVVDGVSLRITGPERVAIVGRNGSGKTTLLRLVTGELRPDCGTVRLGLPAEEVAFFDQHTRRLRDDASVLRNYRVANPDVDETAARHALARFLFEGDSVHQSAGSLSGGQRLRAALACALNGWHPPRLLLLDEPTNHLDLDSLEALEQVLRGYDGALLVVSHDAAFLDAIGIERRIELAVR
ncbi:MAG TPA: ABC-F family ATP-binding cassette domain-containing protein [Longimicrobium sp.]|uniref:ABC-F family ATP-binding cassette domain-containing protein n=1 Tax=Longimicrobium sp. TaxID=2029185 RepID=UPI002ED892B9